MQKSTKWTGLGVAGALTAAALIVPGISVAQSDDAPEDGTEESIEREGPWAEKRQEFTDRLAEELGITSEELQEAFDTVRGEMKEEFLAELRERLDQKVADGEITQERADEIWERAEDGNVRGFMHRRWHRNHDGAFGPRNRAPGDDAEIETSAA